MRGGAAPLIGIIGGYGAVGASAARCLAAEGRFRLRVGGRDPGAARASATALGKSAHAMAVDAGDFDSLVRFSRGCHTVLNCAGPAYLLLDGARRAAFAAEADYADVMDDGTAPDPVDGRTAVLSAGLAPGLSGLLPALLSEGLAEVIRFRGCYAGLGAFTRTGAADYLLSLERGYGTSMAAWRGRVVTGALQVEESYRVPGLPRPLTAYPFLTEELVSRARALGIGEAHWYNAFDGSALVDAVNRLRSGPPGRRDPLERADELVRASALDAAGRTPYHVLHGILEGVDRAGTPVTRTALIRGEDGSELTGAVGAFAAAAVCDGLVPRGVHRAAEVLPARAAADWLRRCVPGATVTVTGETSAPATEAEAIEEGEL